MPAFIRYFILLIACSSCLLSGCQMMPHALQPQQLRKLNRGPALGRHEDHNFSIPDPDLPVQAEHRSSKADPFR